MNINALGKQWTELSTNWTTPTRFHWEDCSPATINYNVQNTGETLHQCCHGDVEMICQPLTEAEET